MRSAALSLLVVAAVAARLSGQAPAEAPPTPAAPTVARVQGAPAVPSREWQQKVRALSDSIRDVAQELAQARRDDESDEAIAALEQRLGDLTGRMAELQQHFHPFGPDMPAEARAAIAAARAGAAVGALPNHEKYGAFPNTDKFGARPMVVVHDGDHSMSRGELLKLIKNITSDPHGAKLPPLDSIQPDDFEVAAGSTVGRVAAVGDLNVFGTVNGDAVALDGDVVVHKGAHIKGDAVAVSGTVQLDGGTVDGEMRSLDEAVAVGAAPAAARGRSAFGRIFDELQAAMAWLVAMVVLGFAAMVFAEDRLRVVASTIEARFGRSLFFGVLAEVSFIPGLVLATVLLAITIVGILLVPVALLAIPVVTTLLSVLGFLAVSRVAGQALTRRAASVSVRGAELRSMLAGLFFFFGLWLAAAILGWVPVLGALLHALAFVVTWAAATVGLGAAILSRGGSPARAPEALPFSAAPDIGWQTPTPISGIAAARRPATSTPEL